jgi:tRNA pseudouridine55 synthase
MDVDGVLLIDKQVGHTSFETVRMIRKKLNVRKAGHAGTLDKSASGLLILCIGRATSLQSLFMGQMKRYRGVIRFGMETDTLDRYGSIVKTGNTGGFQEGELHAVLPRFRGRVKQIPPLFSALHRDGERLYRIALRGDTVRVEPREIEIREISLLQNEAGSITVEVLASKGTYIRSLARDIAAALGTCGFLAELRRTGIGPFSVERAIRADRVDRNTVLIPLIDAINEYPRVELEEEMVPRIQNGMPAWKFLQESDVPLPDEDFLCLTRGRDLIAVIRLKPVPEYLRVFRGSTASTR